MSYSYGRRNLVSIDEILLEQTNLFHSIRHVVGADDIHTVYSLIDQACVYSTGHGNGWPGLKFPD